MISACLGEMIAWLRIFPLSTFVFPLEASTRIRKEYPSLLPIKKEFDGWTEKRSVVLCSGLSLTFCFVFGENLTCRDLPQIVNISLRTPKFFTWTRISSPACAGIGSNSQEKRGVEPVG